jgi:hypothetical protein
VVLERRGGVRVGHRVPGNQGAFLRVNFVAQGSRQCAIREVGEGADVEEGEEDHLETREEGGESHDDLVCGPVLPVLDHADRHEEAQRCARLAVSEEDAVPRRGRLRLARFLPEGEEHDRLDAEELRKEEVSSGLGGGAVQLQRAP